MDTSVSYQEKKAEFGKLPNDEFWVMAVLSVIGYPVNSSSVRRVLARMSVRPEAEPSFSPALVEQQLLQLEGRGMAYIEDSSVCIKNEWREPAARYLFMEHPDALRSMIRYLRREEGLSRGLQSFQEEEESLDFILKRARLHFLAREAQSYYTFVQSATRFLFFDEYARARATEELNSFFIPFDASFFESQEPYFLSEAIAISFECTETWGEGTVETLSQSMAKLDYVREPEGAFLRSLLAHTLVLKGNDYRQLTGAAAALRNLPSGYGLQAFSSVLRGDWENAASAVKKLEQVQGHELQNDLWGVFYLLYQCRERKMKQLKPLLEWTANVESGPLPNLFAGMQLFLLFHIDSEEEALEEFQELFSHPAHPLEQVFLLLFAYWMGYKADPYLLEEYAVHLDSWEEARLDWLCGETANVLAELQPLHPKASQWKASALFMAEENGFHYLTDFLPRQAAWERTLNALERLSGGPAAAGSKAVQPGARRMVWFVDFEQQTIQPKEQKLGKRGKWSPGRKVEPTALIRREAESIRAEDYVLTEALRTGMGHLPSDMFYYGDEHLEYDFEHALYLLAEHPHVYLEGPQHIPLELVRGKPELLIAERGGELHLQFRPRASRKGYVAEKETPTRYRVYHITEEELEIARAVGQDVLIPQEGRGRVEQIVQQLRGKVQIQTPTDMTDQEVQKVAGDPMTCLHLLPFGEGFKLEFYVKPLHPAAHYFKPGKGMPTRLLHTEEGTVACERDLDTEKDRAQSVIEACPSLQQDPAPDYEWQMEDTEQCLQLLLEIQPLKEAGLIRLEHPKGERVRLSGIGSMDQFSVQIQQQRDWFEIDGNLSLSEGEVLDFQRLLDHVRRSDSPFVELKEGEFVALTEAFRDRLKELDGMLLQRGKKLELSALAGLRMDQLAEEMGELEADMAWAERMERIQKAQRIRPRVPSGFQAELRAYQKEGFRWMMRLAEWGVGGCLADDMGLGKTVQALAVLSARADIGPSLVIAPASVTRNWLRETERFAPQLRPHLLGSSKEVDVLTLLQPGDLLIVSYGLLPFVDEALKELHFANIVLDEAQAIKNSATKRSQAVMELQADFRLATTGTPIENHLGELWNLFRFLNAGLLGSKQRFNDKFAKPITRDKDEQRREQLRRLIQPFILRRRKSEVLTELPDKTEVVLSVELSESEQAFYEALRRQALDAIQSADDASKRFTLLAQLTKLRQAACHPLLVEPRTHLASSKLELVGATILELLENGHKALIFSQFVKHLKLIEQWVKNQGISYQYLDGQTPGKKREAAVQAFQQGEGELFLISLKAGGTGLNLTAADYVLHLDPWWNPAVEDQASDRAHRIGQQRPVTVYRFVSENTIEEKIVALHEEKRELADQLLAGTDQSAKLSVDEMIAMIRG